MVTHTRLAPAFAAMAPPDAEAVALARLVGLKEDRIAAALGVELPEIRRRLRSGLTAAKHGVLVTAVRCGRRV